MTFVWLKHPLKRTLSCIESKLLGGVYRDLLSSAYPFLDSYFCSHALTFLVFQKAPSWLKSGLFWCMAALLLKPDIFKLCGYAGEAWEVNVSTTFRIIIDKTDWCWVLAIAGLCKFSCPQNHRDLLTKMLVKHFLQHFRPVWPDHRGKGSLWPRVLFTSEAENPISGPRTLKCVWVEEKGWLKLPLLFVRIIYACVKK